jgi:hypothetical protein
VASTSPASGPLAWRNWRAADDNADFNGGFEYELHTDAYVDGAATTGPYQWINTFASNARPIAGVATPAITLRVAVYLTDDEFTAVDFDKPNTKDYLAGDMGDELASLASLALHRRLRSAGLTRRFEHVDHPGIPFQPFYRVPRLGVPMPGATSMLPGITDRVDPAGAQELLEKYPRLTLNNARALARASRLFAQALWIADDDPAQAWLRLVSAVESAAAQWKSEGGTSLDRLQRADPELADLVRQAGAVADELADRLVVTAKATAKFVDFLAAHLPAPPSKRPAYGVVDWDDLQSGLRKIYDHRSRDLHAGTPFPGPLCVAPDADGDGVPTERVHSLGVAGQGGVWSEEDLPLHLHTFAHIAGGALRSWWHSLA